MRIYQVYRWCNSEGPLVTFYRNKAEATKAAKKIARENEIDDDIEVSVFDLPLNKDGVVQALNCLHGRNTNTPSKLIASYESKVIDFEVGWGE